MALVREITVAFRLSPAKIERHSFTVPADAIPATLEDAAAVLQAPAVRQRFTAVETPVFVEISDPFDPAGHSAVFFG